MFTTLIESRGIHARRTGGTTVSAAVHGVLIVAAIAGTARDQLRMPHDAPVETPVYVTPRADPQPVAQAPSPAPTSAPAAPPRPVEIVIAPPTITPVGLPPIGAGREIPTEGVFIGRGMPNGAPVGPAIPANGVLDAEVVDRPPAVLGQPRPPRYPAILRESATEGRVVVRFVVDTSGHAEMDGLTVAESSNSLFADAVRAALPDYRFSPGEMGGRKVRTMVQMPFVFSVR